MGLDQFLTKRTFIGNNYPIKPTDGSKTEKLKFNIKGLPKEIKIERITYIEEEIGYWRKANGIHNWFVKNCQNGNDDCKSYYIPKEKIEELLKICIEINEKYKENEKKGISTAKQLLPTQSGFFFGSTEYDKWYFNDIKETIKILETTLTEITNDKNSGSIYYRSSW